MNYQITAWCQQFWTQHIEEGDSCIDATAGTGQDTAYLAKLCGETGKVLAFDIQEIALEQTRERLEKLGYLQRVELILDSHEHLEAYAKENSISCVTFNFGYLPKGDHRICTKKESSIRAMEAALRVLKKGGLMSLCIYSGGDSGFEEKDAILAWLKQLDSKKYLVIVSEYYNRPNYPPIPVQVVKLRGDESIANGRLHK